MSFQSAKTFSNITTRLEQAATNLTRLANSKPSDFTLAASAWGGLREVATDAHRIAEALKYSTRDPFNNGLQGKIAEAVTRHRGVTERQYYAPTDEFSPIKTNLHRYTNFLSALRDVVAINERNFSQRSSSSNTPQPGIAKVTISLDPARDLLDISNKYLKLVEDTVSVAEPFQKVDFGNSAADIKTALSGIARSIESSTGPVLSQTIVTMNVRNAFAF